MNHITIGLYAKAALLFFTTFYLCMLVWVLRRRQRSHYENMAHLPLEIKGEN